MDANTTMTEGATQKSGIESLSKDEIIHKYKGLLALAKKAKLAKDELAEENAQLKEELTRNETQKDADKKALLTMKEMLEQFTENKLQLSTKIGEMQQQSKKDEAALEELRNEKESLQRQVARLTDDNESLLQDIDQMENQLQQVNRLSNEQKTHLELLEMEVNKLKEAESHVASLQNQLAVCKEETKALNQAADAARKEHNELNEKYVQLKEINSEQRKKFNALKDRFVDVYRKVKKLKECKRILLETQHEYGDAVSRWQMEIIEASRQLCAQMNLLKSENEELKQKLATQLPMTTTTTAPTSSAEDNIDSPTGGNSTYDLSLVFTKINELQRLSDSAVAEHLEKCQLVVTLREEQQRLENENSALLLQIQQQQVESETTTTTPSSNLAALEASLQSSQLAFTELTARAEQKAAEHADLLDEMRELNEVLKKRGDFISRQQEKQQELTAEMQTMAGKLQQTQETAALSEQALAEREAQLAALQTELAANRAKLEELEAVCARRDEQVRALTDEVQGMRQAGLAAHDGQSDILSTSTISRADEANRLREVEEDEGYEEKYHKLRGLAIKLKKKLQDQTARLEEMDRQQQQQRGSVAQQKELDECRKQVAGLQHEKEQNRKLIDSLKADIHKMKSSRKQVNVLNLEIEAAERTLGEASVKLAARIDELHALNAALTTKENTIVQLRKEIALLESAKIAECEHSKDLKDQIDLLQTQLKDTVHGKHVAVGLNKELEQSLELVKFDLEEARLQLARTASQQEQALAGVQGERVALEQRLLQLEDTLRTTQASLSVSERTLADLRVEYLDYKVKAQSVLRKNQSKDTTRERELEEELLTLRAAEAQLKGTLQAQQAQLAEFEKQKERILEENVILQRRCQETLAIADELRQQNDSLAAENQEQVRSHQEALRNYRQQIEQLDAQHKEKLQEMELRQRLHHDKLDGEQVQQARPPPSVGAISAGHVGQIAAAYPEQSKIDFLLMEREDAEGSEEAEAALNYAAAKRKISTASRRSQHDCMPLDELLNMPMASIVSDTVTTLDGTTDEFVTAVGVAVADRQTSLQLQATRERLVIQESRVRHLTSLLAENEQDLARLTQMNDMLKEELRRQERSEEREKHMHNSEYLKNVVVKFLTLSSADERQRLVPVLNTILKLSRSETELLNCAAKGQRVSLDNRSGWSNFLPSWGGVGASTTNTNNNNNNSN